MQLNTTNETSFQGTRFGSLAELELARCRTLLEELERYSDRYLAEAQRCGKWPAEYPWPLDALHCNTRVWEYPYVLDAIERYSPTQGRVLDIGSALTFLPSFLASKGLQVVASDIDERMPRWFAEIDTALAEKRLWPRENLTYRLLDVTRLDPDSEPFDVVTNVSVLEHLPISLLASAASSIRGILRPGGIFICTLDCWMSGRRTDHHHPLDQEEFQAFMDVLLKHFELVEPPQLRVPSDLITNDFQARSAGAEGGTAPRRRLDRYLRRIAKAVLGRPEIPGLRWCVFGMTLRNR